MNTTNAIKSIRGNQGAEFAITVSNMYHVYRGVKGFNDYDALFAAVETQYAFIGVDQQTAEQRTKNVLDCAEIFPMIVRLRTWLKKFFSPGIC